MQLDNLIPLLNGNIFDFMFYLVTFVSIPLAIGVVLDKVIIRSGFMLIGLFGAICCMFLLLQAQFLALAQLMIYAVGITLVVVIALMLTNPILEEKNELEFNNAKVSGIFLSLAVFITLYCAIQSETWPINTKTYQIDALKVIGVQLMTNYSIPFEFSSLLLLIALIGAVMIAKRKFDFQDNALQSSDTNQSNDKELVTSNKK